MRAQALEAEKQLLVQPTISPVKCLFRKGKCNAEGLSDEQAERVDLVFNDVTTRSVDVLPVRKANIYSLLSTPKEVGGSILFYDRRYAFFELSNYAPFELLMGSETWPTSEHYYQAEKFVEYPLIQKKINQLPTPGAAFAASHEHSSLVRSDWSAVKDDVMLVAVRAKFEQHADLRALLLSTGLRPLIEHTSKDGYWGDNGDGTGRNQMGKTLMAVRAEIQSR
jgi:ribA/ribD-fused uncharacterized protein